MKKLFIALLIVFSVSSQAQDLKWHTNYKEASAESAKTNKPLLVLFTGSDWCMWCVRLKKEILLTPEFAVWAKQNVVLVELDFPEKKKQSLALKKQNAELQQTHDIKGYPTVIFLKVTTVENGTFKYKYLGETGYDPDGPKVWQAVAESKFKKK